MSLYLTHPLLAERRVEHGFGLRGAPEPADLIRPRQVHGAEVLRVSARPSGERPRADALVCDVPALRIGIATADCVPILLAAAGGRAVAAVHAGWRGLARGVVAAGVDALRQAAAGAGGIAAAIGPHIGPCCYEIDEPVIEALSERFGRALPEALRHVGGGRALLDLGALARSALVAAGLEGDRVGQLPAACTRCDAGRFHSYRRDGARAGRLLHFIAARLGEG